MDKGDSAYSRRETKGDDDYRTDTDAKPFREALTCEINSALLSSGNHSTDNIFIEEYVKERISREVRVPNLEE